MNIFEAPAEVFSEAPARRIRPCLPKVNPGIVAREHIENGVPTIALLVPRAEGYFHITPKEWELLQLFDGERTFSEIAQIYTARTGVPFSENEVADLASAYESTPFFYKSPAEKNAAIMQSLLRERSYSKKRNFDLSEINVVGWDPDSYLTWIHDHFRFVCKPWCTVLTLASLLFMGWIFLDNWGPLWQDTFEYYTFGEKGLSDLAEFWVLFGVMVFFHESAHGFTCKHYGGEVHRMGFMLMFFCPAFYCDVSEAWVYANKWQRIVTMLAGIWVEMILCAFATLLWWTTPAGMWLHDFAYKLILVSGIGVVVLNLNPLIKLDGYFILGELLGITDLKEKSTAYVSKWSRWLFRLPAEREYLPRHHAWGFIAYAILSASYTYLLLFVVVRWTYNIAQSYSPEWAFLPALAMTWVVFKGRIKSLGRFMKIIYLEKKQHLKLWITPGTVGLASVLLLILFAVPVWRDTAQARFILEPVQRAIIRSEVPGMVSELLADEGQSVVAGAQLARLQNLDLESRAAEEKAKLQVASAQATEAQLNYASFGPANRERQRIADQQRALAEETAKLSITSPVSGIVLTPHPRDLVGSFVRPGDVVLDVGELKTMRARLYIPEFVMRDVNPGQRVSVHLDGTFQRVIATVQSIAPAASRIPDGLTEKSQYQGIQLPNYYIVNVLLNNPGTLHDGMTGEAKVLIAHRSLAALTWRFFRDSVSRRIW